MCVWRYAGEVLGCVIDKDQRAVVIERMCEGEEASRGVEVPLAERKKHGDRSSPGAPIGSSKLLISLTDGPV